MTIDGFDPSELTRPAMRRRRREANNDTDELRPKGDAFAASPRQTPREGADPRRKSKNVGQTARPDARREEPELEARVEEDNAGGAVSAVVRFFTDDRLRLFLGVAMLLMCIFILIAIVSHFRAGEYDQSLVLNSTLAEMGSDPSQVRNAGGGFGAWLSNALLCDALGLGSIVFIGYSAILALALLGFRKCKFWALTFRTLLLAVTISLVLGLVTFYTPSVIKWGGNHGYYINKLLIDNGTIIGAICVSALMVGAVVSVYLHELRDAWKRCTESAKVRRLQEQLKKQKDRALENIENMHPAKDEPAAAETISVADEIGERKHDSPEEELFDSNDGSDLGGFSLSMEPEEPIDIREAKIVREEAPITIDSDPAPVATAPAEEFSVVTTEIEKAEGLDESDNPQNDAMAAMGPYDHRADLYNYQFPPVELLKESGNALVVDMEEQQANKERIVKTLADYNIAISKIEATVGPTITLYEIVPAEGVRISSIKRLEDDIAMSLSALGIRIIAPIPGKGTVGIEVPNTSPQTVSMHSVITSKKYQECKMALPMALGATISNDIFIADMAKMPHLLVAGATGMGKSVGLNAIIASLIYKKHPSELKFVLVDPKMVEFSLYNKLERHYLAKLSGDDDEDAVITESAKVIQTLNSLCVEMDSRYALLRDANVRALEEYNDKFTARRLNPERGHRYLPYIVVIVDEFADLLMVAGKEVEAPIMRIAQKARAVGIHMIIATQRPATNVITGNIKANFPGRIAFRVIQMVDSKTILDATGANQLIGRGDMLFSHNGNVSRVQCAFISTEEVEAITDWVSSQPGYSNAYMLPDVPMDGGDGSGPVAGASGEKDPLFDEAAQYVVHRQIGSTSSLQRQFNIGYNRAGRLMDQLAAAGIVGPVNGAKPRAILVDASELESILGR